VSRDALSLAAALTRRRAEVQTSGRFQPSEA